MPINKDKILNIFRIRNKRLKICHSKKVKKQFHSDFPAMYTFFSMSVTPIGSIQEFSIPRELKLENNAHLVTHSKSAGTEREEVCDLGKGVLQMG